MRMYYDEHGRPRGYSRSLLGTWNPATVSSSPVMLRPQRLEPLKSFSIEQSGACLDAGKT